MFIIMCCCIEGVFGGVSGDFWGGINRFGGRVVFDAKFRRGVAVSRRNVNEGRKGARLLKLVVLCGRKFFFLQKMKAAKGTEREIF